MVSLVCLCLLLGAGYLLRIRIKLFQKLFLPACVVGGLLGLLIIQGFAAMDGLGEPIQRINAVLSGWTGPWKKLPAYSGCRDGRGDRLPYKTTSCAFGRGDSLSAQV